MAFRDMRRSRQQLRQEETEDILRRGKTGILAVNGDGGYPYAVPVNYVYQDGKILFHGAKEGHKFDAMAADEKVSFCVIDRDEVVPEKLTTAYRSAIAFGKVRLLEGEELVRAAYALGVKYYDAPQAVREHIDGALGRLACYEIAVEHLTGKEGLELTKRRTQ